MDRMKKLPLLLSTAALAHAAMPAQAQEASRPTPQVETGGAGEIVVTAQRREERLQDVPITVSVVTGDEAVADGAKGFETLAGQIPGLQVFGIDQLSMQFAIRGVITDRTARTPQTAALYFDDVPIGLGSANPNLQQFDVERIEILRGPQGTLYGAGAQSGAIRVINRKPRTDRFEWAGGAELSSTDGGGINTLVHGVVNVPVSETAAVRMVGYTRDQSGYIDNVNLGRNNSNRTSIDGVRGSLLYAPGERLRLTGVVAYQELRADNSDLADRARPDYTIANNVLQWLYGKNLIGALTAEYEFDFATLTSVTSYQNTDSFRNIDASRFPVILGALVGAFPTAAFPTHFRQDGWSKEVRLTSPGDRPFTWIAGAFYSNVTASISQSFVVPGFEAAVPAAPRASSFGLQQDNLYEGLQRFRTRQFALFVDGTLNLTERLAASGGVRWYSYNQDGVVDYNGYLQGRRDRVSDTAKADGFNPRFNLSYRLGESSMVYAQVARGFRVGGLNEPIPAAVCGADLAAIGLSAPPTTYNPDKLWSYELGVKGAVGRTFSFNGAIFQVDWDDIQVTKRLGCGYAAILNGGSMRSRGVELEASVRPTSWLSFSGNLAHTDSKITATSNATGLGTSVGQRAPYQPRWTYNLSGNLRVPLSDEVTGFATVDYSYTGKRRTDFNPATAFQMPSFETVGLQVGLQHGDLKGFLFVDNLTNDYGVLDITRRGGFLPVITTTTPIRPRTIGVRLIKSL